jgi:uncharacterized protein (TIGR04551 family)
MLFRLSVVLVALFGLVSAAMGQAKSKKDKTDWDEGSEKELPPLELHGYFRLRGDLFHNYALGYTDKVAYQFGKLTSYFTPFSERNPNGDINGLEQSKATATRAGASTLGTATMRFRLEPTINVTEDVRIKAQIDVFDNLVMGSTPEGFPSPSGLVPIIAFTKGAVPPSDGTNALQDSIRVKRAWGEVMTPFGMLAFGRMGSHWGMGLLANDGSCLDCDYGTTYDRVMFVTKVAGHYIVPIMDFASEGLTSDVAEMVNVYRRGSAGLGSVPVIDRYLGRPFDLDQRDDVSQYGLAIAKRDSPKEIKEKLENGEMVLNYGLYTIFRNQAYTTENRAYATSGNAYQGRLDTPDLYRQPLFEHRGARAWILDPWIKFMYRKLVLEFEAAMIFGSIDESVNGQPVDIRQFGLVLRVSNKFLNDTLLFTFETGFASGSDGIGLGVRDTAIVAPTPPIDPVTGKTKLCGTQPCPARATNFKFDPDFHVDMIFWRQIIGTVTDAWYVKPTIQYNVTEGFGLRLSAIYSAAVNTLQWPGQTSPLGLEFDFDIFYKSEEFLYASLGYGGFIPFSGLKDATTQVSPTYAQTVFVRLVIRY